MRVHAVIFAMALAGAAGCGTSRDPVYYALQPRGGAVVAARPRLVELERPEVAGYLDRSDIVTGVVGYRLHTRSGDAWGEPLADMIGRVLADDLGARLSGANVVLESSGASTTEPDARVAVDVRRFDAGDDGNVVLVAQVVVEPKAGSDAPPGPPPPPIARTFKLTAKPTGGGTGAIVATMSGLLSELADRISAMLAA